MHLAIQAEHVAKRYRLSHRQSGYRTLRESVTHGLADLGRRLCGRGRPQPTAESFWALEDVSFQVRHGERLGIIGANGAGKSTLLKLISRITEPSKGRIAIKGRVASLLEVGTGFHPELSGRENIYLNGAILGMRRREIRRKFDEIVAFAEVERFLDTPVKRYSSGMYVRLAFAVAAHLEPEILLVDEVLAVGDARFQQKCIGKMEAIGNEGRTILFVSHNMPVIRQLCQRAILLEKGRLIADSEPDNVIRRYLDTGSVLDRRRLAAEIAALPEDPVFRLRDITLCQAGSPVLEQVANGSPLEIAIRYQVKEKTAGLRLYFDLCDEGGTILLRSFHDDLADHKSLFSPGEYLSQTVLPAEILGPARYLLVFRATIFNQRCCVPPRGIVLPIQVLPTGRINRAYPEDTFRAKLTLPLEWHTHVVA